MFFGTQYYRAPFPTKDRWEQDFLNMHQLGFNTVKLWAVWNDVEREPGKYCFDELDALVTLAEKNSLQVIINTIPEGAPYWLYTDYPDSLYETVDGKKIGMSGAANMPTGGWPGLCMDDPAVADKICTFIYEVAKHYRNRKSVFAIDVWNEPHMEPAYFCKGELLCACKYSRTAFRRWLQERYGTLEKLNQVWFRRYTNWEQVIPPARFGTYTDMMDWRRFWAENLQCWLRKKVQAAKQGAPEKMIQTHAACSAYRGASGEGSLAFESADEFLLAKEVDIFGLSSFPKWQMGDTKEEYNLAHMFHSDAIAAASREKVFYQVELQGGAGVGMLAHKQPDKDDICVWNWNTIAAGGKGVLYWQYAPEPAGQESPGFGLTDLQGKNTERSTEAGRLAKQFCQAGLDDTKPILSENGIYLSRNSDLLLFAAGKFEKKYTDSLFGIYRTCMQEGIPVRLVHADYMDSAYSEGLRNLYLPMAVSISQKEQEDILAFIRQGGHVTMEAATGLYSDLGDCLCGSILMKGLFAQSNLSVDRKTDMPVVYGMTGECVLEGCDYQQTIQVKRGEVKGWFSEAVPGLISVPYGKGSATWIGTFAALAAEEKQSTCAKQFIAGCFSSVGYSQVKNLNAKNLVVRLLQNKDGILAVIVNQTGSSHPYMIGTERCVLHGELAPYSGQILKV